MFAARKRSENQLHAVQHIATHQWLLLNSLRSTTCGELNRRAMCHLSCIRQARRSAAQSTAATDGGACSDTSPDGENAHQAPFLPQWAPDQAQMAMTHMHLAATGQVNAKAVGGLRGTCRRQEPSAMSSNSWSARIMTQQQQPSRQA